MPTAASISAAHLSLTLPGRAAEGADKTPLRTEDLFRGGQRELLIEHRGECYRLRLTRMNKLILNK